MKSVGLSLIAILFLLLITACGSSESAYEQGLDALHDEDVEAATKAFNQAIDDEEDESEQASKYIEMIDEAESISPFLDDEAYDEALEAYDQLKTEENFSDVYFIIEADVETLDEIISSQANIDGQLSMMKELIDAKIEAVPIYEELLEKISKEKYLSEAQKDTIKALKKDIEALKGDDEQADDQTDDNDDGSSEAETDDEADDSNESDETETESEANDDGSANQDEDNSNDGSEEASDQAYNLVYNYVIEQGIVSKSMLDNGNVKLNMDHQDGSGAYIFQLFEVVSDGGSGHTATWGWYTVDVGSGSVSEAY